MNLTKRFLCLLALLLHALPAQADTAETNGFNVLSYHNVSDDLLADPDKYTISTAALAQQFSWLKVQGYKVISVDELMSAKSQGRPLPAKTVLLTFDDGYQSFYTHVYPLLREFNYPAVLALVGSWLEVKAGGSVSYEGQNFSRDKFLDLTQIRELAASDLVEIASHSYDLHHGVLANPQGNTLAAGVSRIYNPEKNSYESDAEYLSRIRADLTKNSSFIKRIIGKQPRVMVWPYGRYNSAMVNAAASLGMPLNFTLDSGTNLLSDSPSKMKRILIEPSYSVARFAELLTETNQPTPERVVHVDIDHIYDANPVQQEKNLGSLLDRIKLMKISTVYLQAFADADGNGAADSVYFPNRHLPMRADLFSRVAWQLKTRSGVKVYAWMPLIAFELPSANRLARHQVESAGDKTGYPRLTPFDLQVRQTILEIYEDLAKHATFEGILFHDDATLSDEEDGSTWALRHYSGEWGLPASIAEIKRDPASLEKWKRLKTHYLTTLSLELADVVRQFHPQLKTARNLYAEVVLNPTAEEWFAQSLPDFLDSYDYTAVMAMPYMENARQPLPWLKRLVGEIAKYPQALGKVVFELQSVDWRTSKKIDGHELTSQMELLQLQGALNFGYYPDDFLNDSPSLDVIKPFLSLETFPFSGR